MPKARDDFLDDLLELLAERVAERVIERLPPPPAPATPPQSAEYLSTAQLAKLLGLSAGTLEGWRARGKGPPWVKIGTVVHPGKERHPQQQPDRGVQHIANGSPERPLRCVVARRS